MGITTALWPFALVVGLLTLTPRLDTALILRTAASVSGGGPGAWCSAFRPAPDTGTGTAAGPCIQPPAAPRPPQHRTDASRARPGAGGNGRVTVRKPVTTAGQGSLLG
jgi:hypothetical protein